MIFFVLRLQASLKTMSNLLILRDYLAESLYFREEADEATGLIIIKGTTTGISNNTHD